MCSCPSQTQQPAKRRPGILSVMVQILVLYALMVFGGGTLIRTGHPVAQEVGRLIHLATFVTPTIHWADDHDYSTVSNGLRLLSHGYPIERT